MGNIGSRPQNKTLSLPSGEEAFSQCNHTHKRVVVSLANTTDFHQQTVSSLCSFEKYCSRLFEAVQPAENLKGQGWLCKTIFQGRLTMTVFQKLGVCAAITIMFVGTFSGCCGGKRCGLFGGGHGAAGAAECQSCSSQGGYSQPGSVYSQPGSGSSQPAYSQPYSQPAYSNGAGSGSVNVPAYSPGPSAGSGTSAPIFNGGSGGR